MVSTLLTFLLFICFAGIIYPFRPFKSRKWACGLSILVFILVVAVFTIEENNPELIAERTEAAITAKTEAEKAFGTGDVGKARAILEALDYGAANQEKEILSPMKSKIEAAEIRPTLNAILSNDDLETDQKLIKLDKAWKAIESEGAKSLLADSLEVDLLALITPLPASDFTLNKAGYTLLDVVDAVSSERDLTYDEKARDYSKKITEAKKAEVLESVKEATRGLNRDYDKIAKVTWFRHPNSPKYVNSRTTAHLYLGVPDSGGAGLRLKTSYVADEWLFIENVTAFIDGETYPLTDGHFKRDANSKIWEWRDEIPSLNQISTLMKMAEGSEVILRFNGTQYRKDKVFSDGDKRALKAILTAYGDISQ